MSGNIEETKAIRKLINDLNQSIEIIKKQSEAGSTLPAKVSISATMKKVEKSIEHYKDCYNTILFNKPDLPKQYQEQVNELLGALEQKKENLEKFLKERKLSPKRKNTEQVNEVPEKKRRKGKNTTGEIMQQALRAVINFDSKAKGFTGPFSKKIDELKKYINYVQHALDSINKIYCKLDNLEEKRQKVGQFLLKELLNMADESNLTDEKKEKILNQIKNLVTPILD